MKDDDVLKLTLTVKEFEYLADVVAMAAVYKALELIADLELRAKAHMVKEESSIKPVVDPARANLELIKEIEARGKKPIFDESGFVLGCY